MQRPGSENNRVAVRIHHTPVDICPLCEEQIDAFCGDAVRVTSMDRVLFFAHRKCVVTFAEVMDRLFKED